LIIPLKATIFQKFPFTIYIEISSFASHYRQWWQAADQRKIPVVDRKSLGKLVCTFLLSSLVGEQIGGDKLAVLLSPWRPLVKLFSQGSRPHTTKIGHGHTGYQSIEPRTGYQINLRSGATGKNKFYIDRKS
jgi:hypothetical protein